MKIWAHRGCSQMYPENTLTAFEKAAEINGLAGIELDIQLTRDGYMAVCHDERVDRTTDGIGELRSFTLAELKKLNISAGNEKTEKIPTIEEVLDLLQKKIKNGLNLNIELKNSVIPYEGMEQKIIDLVYKYGIQDHVIYSSFNEHSVRYIKEINAQARTGILDRRISDCLNKMKNICNADALHPNWRGINISKEKFAGYAVRAWFTGHLYPEKPTGTKLDLDMLEQQGITDVFLNEPEAYLM